MSRLVDPVPHVRVNAEEGIKYCLHESRTRPGARALVLNHFAGHDCNATVSWMGGTGVRAKVYTINGESREMVFPAEIIIPQGDCCVVVPLA